MASDKEFPGISGKEDNLAKQTHIFENFLPEISVILFFFVCLFFVFFQEFAKSSVES